MTSNAGIQPQPPAADCWPPGSIRPFTTLHVGMIAGGTANNITAADCRYAVEMRVVPGRKRYRRPLGAAFAGTRRSGWMRSLKARHPEAGVNLARFFGVPGLVPEQNRASQPRRCLARRLTGRQRDRGGQSYGTEAGQFQQQGYSAIICGPGSIAQAHQPDEFLEVSEFLAGQSLMEALLGAIA